MGYPPQRVVLFLCLLACVALGVSSTHPNDVVTSVVKSTVSNIGNARPGPGSVGDHDLTSALYLLEHESTVPFRRIVSLLYRSSRQGNADAQFYLGVLHTFGIGVVKSEAKAVSYYTMSALSGSPEAAVVLSNRYEHGIGVPADILKAAEFAKSAASRVAKDYSIENRQRIPYTLLEDAHRPSRRSQLSHSGVSDDAIVQMHVYRSEKGDLESKMALGYIFLYGQHSQEVDPARAFRHFEDALEKKHPQAFGALGQMYMHGVAGYPPIKADEERAFRLFENGHALGDAVSMNGLGYFYARSATLRLAPAEQEERFKKAAEYYAKAAATGNADATYNLAVLRLHGKGVPKDIHGSRLLLQIASGKGSLLASWQLGLLSMVAESGNARSDAVALRFFKLVMDKGSWRRHAKIAEGGHFEGNDRLALVEYLIASELGLPNSRRNALFILSRGSGLAGIDVVRHTNDETAEELSELVSSPSESHRLSQSEAIDELVLTIILRSAMEGDKMALLRLGDHYYSRGNFSRSLSCYEQASTGEGSPQAMFNLALMYQHGVGTVGGLRDFSSAKRYFDAAMERSNRVGEGDAYYAVQGALFVLNFQYWIHHFGDWSVPGTALLHFVNHSFLSPFGVAWDDWLLGLAAVSTLVLLLLRNQVAEQAH